jgi:peptide-methionine (R)-S-oxide reductase
MKSAILALACAGLFATAVRAQNAAKPAQTPNPSATTATRDWKKVSDAEWRKLLKPKQYQVLRKAATEYAFQNELWNNHKTGQYLCAGCGNLLFSSEQKFESGTGWPSFWKPLKKESVVEKSDPDGSRTEVNCARCDGHLGHVFDDGPKPTGLRYCMNSAAMNFVAEKKK